MMKAWLWHLESLFKVVMIINKWEKKVLFHNGLSREPLGFVIFNKIIEMQFFFPCFISIITISIITRDAI